MLASNTNIKIELNLDKKREICNNLQKNPEINYELYNKKSRKNNFLIEFLNKVDNFI